MPLKTFLGIISLCIMGIFGLILTSDTYRYFKSKTFIDISPQFEGFTDMYGNTKSYGDFRGKRVLIGFGYTTCIDICPVTLASLTNLLYDIEDTYGIAEANKFQVLYFTVDPDRDTPEVLYDIIHDVYHPAILGLVGDMKKTEKLSDQFLVSFRKSQQNSEYYTVTHTANIFLIDENGTYKTQFAHTAPPKMVLPIIYKYFKKPKT